MTEAASPGVLANRDFVKLWTGETVSLVGSQVTQLALPLVAILTLHASVFEVGVLNATRYAPVVAFSLLAGVWLDRRRRRPALVAADLACALLIAAIPLAHLTGVLTIWLLYAIAFLAGAAQLVFDIGSLSYLPGLVERRHLADANARMQLSHSVAGIAGPSLAGLLVAALTAPISLLVNAVSYLFSMVMLLTIRRGEEHPAVGAEREPVRASIAEGLRAVFGSRVLRALLFQSCTFNFLANALLTVFLVYAIRTLGLTPTQLGFVIGAGAVAGFAGAWFATRMTAALGVGRTLFATTLGACLTPLLLLVPAGAAPGELVVLGVAQGAYGASVVIFNITTVTLRQIVTPNRLLARMNGSYRMLLFGTGPVGALAGGALGAAAGLRPAMVVTAVAMITPSVWILFSPVFRLRRMPAGPDEDLEAASRPAHDPAGTTTG